MTVDYDSDKLPPLMDLSVWRRVPSFLVGAGVVLTLIGLVADYAVHRNLQQFAYSWLLAFMFCLSICLGSLFLVMAHHLFDAGWSVPQRRFLEQLASMLFPWMAILFIPVALLAKSQIYGWMDVNPGEDHSLNAKLPLFTQAGFYAVVVFNFGVWWLLSRGLLKWSLEQDRTGDALCTFKMRGYSYWGIFAFAATTTLAAIMWLKALQYQWFSTMYGVWYFAGSVWVTLGTAYSILAILDRQRVLTKVLHNHQFYYLGTLFFAFTVFYAYITFAQYFIIWNANMPEETFWYVIRENGSWFGVSMIIIFGHFFVPFLAMLRIDVKTTPAIIIPLAAWAWLMHYFDLSFNIMPAIHPGGYPFAWFWLDAGCLAFMVGLLIKVFLRKYRSAAPYPIRDPRLVEAMGISHPIPTQLSGGELDETDFLVDGPPEPEGGH